MGTRNELNNICRMPICTVCVSSSTKAFWSTSMTLLEAAKQALEWIHSPGGFAENDLRAAIKEAEKQEPFGYVDGRGRFFYAADPHYKANNTGMPRVFTHPAPAVPSVNWLAEGTPPKYTPGKSSPPSSSIPEGWNEFLRIERDALKKDAERYRWLLQWATTVRVQGGSYILTKNMDRMNSYIDAAMEESK